MAGTRATVPVVHPNVLNADYHTDGISRKVMTADERIKLEGIEPGAKTGDMLESTYDPDANEANAFDLSNQYGSKPTDFATVADLLADTSLGYSAARRADQVAAGMIVNAQGFRYEVAASGATDHHVETAGGVKLYVLPVGVNRWYADAFAVPSDGVTDAAPRLNVMARAIGSVGAEVLFNGSGIYSIQSTVYWPRKHYLTLDGRGAKFLPARNTSFGSIATHMGLSAMNFGVTDVSFYYFKDHIEALPVIYNVTCRNMVWEGDFSGDPNTNDLVDPAKFTNANKALGFVNVANYLVEDCVFRNMSSHAVEVYATRGKNRVTRSLFETCRQHAIASIRNLILDSVQYTDYVARDEMLIDHCVFKNVAAFCADYHQKNASQYSGMEIAYCTITGNMGYVYKNQIMINGHRNDYFRMHHCYVKPNRTLLVPGVTFAMIIDDTSSEQIDIYDNVFIGLKYPLGRMRGWPGKRLSIRNNYIDYDAGGAVLSPIYQIADGAEFGNVGAVEYAEFVRNTVKAKEVSGLFIAATLTVGTVERFEVTDNHVDAVDVVTPYTFIGFPRARFVYVDRNKINISGTRTASGVVFADAASYGKYISFCDNWLSVIAASPTVLHFVADNGHMTGNTVLNGFVNLTALESRLMARNTGIKANNIVVAP